MTTKDAYDKYLAARLKAKRDHEARVKKSLNMMRRDQERAHEKFQERI